MSWIDWLNANAGAVQALATVVLVLVTGFYAFRTHSIAKASKETAEATKNMIVGNARPLVVLECREDLSYNPNNPRVFVGLVNVGFGPALDVVYDICSTEGGAPVADAIRRLRERNTGYTVGVAPTNIVEVLRGQGLEFDRYTIDFIVEYSDIYGNLYQTTYSGRRTAVNPIPERNLPFPPDSKA